MKIFVNKIDLEYSLNAVSKALANKLEGRNGAITLSAENSVLNLATGNGEIVISAKIQAEVSESGKVNVAGKLFYDTIKTISDNEIEMNVEEKELYIKSADGHVKIPVFDALSDWSDYKKPTNTSEIKLPINEFKNIVKRSSAFCSADDSRPILKGINIKTQGDVLTAVALDGFRLVKTETTITASDTDIDIIAPASALNCISSVLSNDGDAVLQVSNTEKLLQITTQDITFTVVLFQGQFINYDRIIPTSFTTTAKAPKKELLSALDKAVLFGGYYFIADASITPEQIEIASKGEHGEAFTKIKATAKGRDLNIAVNAKYLLSALKFITDDNVNMSFNNPNDPLIITDGGVTFLLLPIRKN